MNVRRPILVAGVLVIALLVALIVWHLTDTVKTATPTENTGTESTGPAGAPAKHVVAQLPESVPGDSDVPIVFYGRLQDQGGQPVVEAEITGTTIFHQGLAKATGRFTTTSDANGLFTLNAGGDESLEVMPRKAGYALASTNNVKTYTGLANETERSPPDSNNPVVIKMWKLQGAEPLVTISQQYQFPYTNAPLFFDFVTQGFVRSGGDIKITIVGPPDPLLATDSEGWRVEMEADQAGGLMQISPEKWRITYWAPTDGYQPKIALPMVEDASQNSESLDGMVFVQTREGRIYAKLAVKISLSNDMVDLDLHGVANTNGSCNWEGDPATLRPE
jgi:hypothetical protein